MRDVNRRLSIERDSAAGLSPDTVPQREKILEGRLAQLARAARLQRAGRGFESLSAHPLSEIQRSDWSGQDRLSGRSGGFVFSFKPRPASQPSYALVARHVTFPAALTGSLRLQWWETRNPPPQTSSCTQVLERTIVGLQVEDEPDCPIDF